MPNQKRERQKAARAARQEALLAAQRRAARRRQVVLLIVAAALMAALLAYCGAFSSSKKAAETGTRCPGAKETRQTSFAAPFRMCIDKHKTYKATITTDVGDVVVELDAKKAPITVNNFVTLARYHYYDGLTFHRVIKDFMIQGGDPKGDGTGGPGYTIAEEAGPGTKYPAGAIAMAKTSAAHSTGSQFFIVASDAGGKSLEAQPTYSNFGRVTSGMDVVKKIEADGGTQQGNGTDIAKKHTITRVTIQES